MSTDAPPGPGTDAPPGPGSGPPSPWGGGAPSGSTTDRPPGPAAQGLPAGHAFEAFDMRVVEVEGADWAMELDVTPRVVNSSGVLQGGLMATLVDMVAGVALLRGEAPYERGSTSELQISYLDAARVGPVVARAHVLRRGRRSAVVRVEVHDRGAGDLHVATATLTFAVRRSGDPGRSENVGSGGRGPEPVQVQGHDRLEGGGEHQS